MIEAFKMDKEAKRMTEIEFRLQKVLDNAKLANSGNRFAQYQRNVNKTGLSVNFEALMKKTCDHTKHLPNGRRIRADSWCESVKVGEFKIQERICTLCTKTLETKIWKPKRPRRGF